VTSKLTKDALPSITTYPEDISEDDIDYEKYMARGGSLKKKFLDFRRPYIPKLMFILIFTFVSSFTLGVILRFTKYFEIGGWFLVVSKGCTMGILLSMGFLLFFVSHDLMTVVRRRWKGWVSDWMDHYLTIHKFWGVLVTIYGIVHSVCHLTGSFRIISSTNEFDEINGKMMTKFDSQPTYSEMLFGTMTGITGLFLLTIILTMAFTSMSCIRDKWFQVFGYTHMTLYPIFWVLMIIHGFGFWFTLGIPFAIVNITPGFFGLLYQHFMRIFSNYFNPFQIIDVSVSFDWSYIMIYLLKPKNYKMVHGQYVFMNVPTIHPLQWHPFTIASSPSSPYLTLMIKSAGDWTGKLIKRLQEDKMRMMKMHEFEFDDTTKYDIFNLLHDLHQEIPLKEVIARNKLFYPKVKISKACSTPNDTFMDNDNIILIGSGSGISPYLPLLEEVIRKDKGESNIFNFTSARLVFIAREGDQISWISNYLFHIISSDWLVPKLEFNIFITLNKNLQNLPSFLFWRAFLLISLSKQIWNRGTRQALPTFRYDSDNMFIDKSEFDNSSIKVFFGRPNFDSLFKASIKEGVKKIHVYSTTSSQVNQAIFDSTKRVEKETGVKFKHIWDSSS
jgi:hypothetical protein